MFGSDLLLERRLRNGAGRAARAEILDGKKGRWVSATGGSDAQLATNAHVTWTLAVRVMPDDEPPFDAEVKQAMRVGSRPMMHAIIPVLYDPQDHSKVIYDKQASARAREQRLAEGRARLDQLKASAGEQQSQPAAAGTMDPITALERLANLHDRGAITDAEFEAQKRKVLGE